MTTDTPLLLIPGNMCDGRLWAHVAVRLERTGRAVALAEAPADATITGMADALLARHPERMIPIGFSMGAIVALEMTRRAPDRIAALGLVAVNASADLPERAAARPQQQEDVRAGRLREVVRDRLLPHYFAAGGHTAGLADLVIDMAMTLGPDLFVAQSEALRTRPDLRPALSTIGVPLLLVCGEEDRLCPPEWHRRWAKVVGPHATVNTIRAAGHMLPLEQPLVVAASLLAWLTASSL